MAGVSPLDRVIPNSFLTEDTPNHELASAFEFWRERGISPEDGVFRVCFLGSLSRMYDFKPVLDAAQELSDELHGVEILICGMGPEATRLRAQEVRSLRLLGWVNAIHASALLRMSHLGLAPYRDDRNFRENFPNKPAEYLAHGLPVLVPIEGVIEELVSKRGCGRRYSDGLHLARLIREYRDERGRLERERSNALAAYRELFDAVRVSDEFVQHLERVRASWLRETEGSSAR